MKTKELRNRLISISNISMGRWEVIFRKRRKEAIVQTTDAEKIDAIKFNHTAADTRSGASYTERQALMFLFSMAK